MDDKRETSCYQTMPCAPRHRGPAMTAPNTRCCQPPQDISLPYVTKRTAMCPSQRAVSTSHRTAVQYMYTAQVTHPRTRNSSVCMVSQGSAESEDGPCAPCATDLLYLQLVQLPRRSVNPFLAVWAQASGREYIQGTQLMPAAL